jgi:hypothetical protein
VIPSNPTEKERALYEQLAELEKHSTAAAT